MIRIEPVYDSGAASNRSRSLFALSTALSLVSHIFTYRHDGLVDRLLLQIPMSNLNRILCRYAISKLHTVCA
jgi:hypothetical protein